MDPTEIEVIEIEGPYPEQGTELEFTAADIANGNTFRATGREIVLWRNVSVDTAADVTITSTPNELGRTGDFTEEVPFGGAVYGVMLALSGWQNASRNINLEGETVDIEFCILRLPTRPLR